VIFPQLLHINSSNEAYMLQRPSSLFWCHNVTSFSCLEISSVTLTPMSSPDSNLSAGLLTPPPVKPALSKPPSGASVPRPPVKHFPFTLSLFVVLVVAFSVVSSFFFYHSLQVLPSDFKGLLYRGERGTT